MVWVLLEGLEGFEGLGCLEGLEGLACLEGLGGRGRCRFGILGL